jgi:hypothetical protein
MTNSHHETMRPRRLFHQLVTLTISITAAAVAMQWAGASLRESTPGLPTLRFIDSFSVVAAITLITLSLSMAWQAGRSRKP